LAALEQFENRLDRLNVWTVKFVHSLALNWGESLLVSGDCESLGDSDWARGVAMTCGSDNVWSVTVPKVPEGTRYRYMIRKENGAVASQTEYHLELASVLSHCNVVDKMLVVDDSYRYLRFKVHRADAKQVFVTGSLPELGAWKKDKALELKRKAPTSNTWEAVLQIQAQLLPAFEYKFFEIPSHGTEIRFESGANRISDAHLVEPQREVITNAVDAVDAVDAVSPQSSPPVLDFYTHAHTHR
jgi:hypothetical protein